MQTSTPRRGKLTTTAKRLMWVLLIAATSSGGEVQSAPISVANPGFETILLGHASFPNAADWSAAGLPKQMQTGLHASFPVPNNAGLGSRFGFHAPNELKPLLDTGVSFAAFTEYQLASLAVLDNNSSVNQVVYEIGYDDGGFQPLASQSYLAATPAVGWTLTDGVTYETGALAPEIGANILLRIYTMDAGSGNGSAVWVDNATLDAMSVPEPSSLALLAVGLIGFSIARRRQAH